MRSGGRGRVWRRRAIALCVLAAIAVLGYFLWLRDSSLFAVDEVKVEGVSANREQVTAALEQAAEGMTTLHVDEGELRDAVSAFPTVASIRVDASPPGSLTIVLTERLPVGTVESGGERVPVSGDGYVLTGLDTGDAKLPAIEAREEAGRVDPEGREQAAILAAAPPELLERITEAAYDPERGGVVVELDASPELRFGDAADAERKWAAAVTVLADRRLGSPGYVDVAVPERPVTGG